MKWIAIPLLLLNSQLAYCQEWQKSLSPSKLGTHPAIAPSSLDYTLSWNGTVDSGKIHVEFAPKNQVKPNAYIVKATANSIGAGAALYTYSSSIWAELRENSFKPAWIQTIENITDETVTSTSTYTDKEVTCVESCNKKKKPPTSSTHNFHFSNVFDIFSAILFVRSQDLKDNDTLSLVVQPYKSPYLLNVSVVGRELHMERNAIKLSATLQKIDSKTLELKAYKKMTHAATLWISDDPDRVPLEFRAKIFVGDIRVTLSQHQKF